MLAFAVEGVAYGGKGFGERKYLRGDEQVGILRADRMPIDAVGGYRDFWQQIGACQRNALGGEATQGIAADHPVLLRDLSSIEEMTEFLGLGVGRDGRRQSHSKSFCASALDACQCTRPAAGSAMAVVLRGRRTVEADLQGQTVTRQ